MFHENASFETLSYFMDRNIIDEIFSVFINELTYTTL